MRDEIRLNLDDLVKLRRIIKKYFPENKVGLKAYNSPEDGELEVIINIEVSAEYGVRETIDKFDEEMFDNRDLEERLGFICVTTKYV
jgi:hypothetical protein